MLPSLDSSGFTMGMNNGILPKMNFYNIQLLLEKQFNTHIYESETVFLEKLSCGIYH